LFHDKKSRRFWITLSLVLIVACIVTNLSIYTSSVFNNGQDSYNSAHRLPNGDTLIAETEAGGLAMEENRLVFQSSYNTSLDSVIEVTPSGTIAWAQSGFFNPHEALLAAGYLFVADTEHDRVVAIDYPSHDIVWSWEPAKINWTQVNPEWGPGHYYNKPIATDWTHVNEVHVKNYGSWTACLISLRNFDLVVEVNFTADLLMPSNAANIVWYYGDYGNHSLLFHQHDPVYLPDGNVLISDSDNNRIVEINYTTRKEMWEYQPGDLNWPRSATLLPDGNMIISHFDEIRIINTTTKSTVWSYTGDFYSVYAVDYLPNGDILFGSDFSHVVEEVSPSGTIIWEYGQPFIRNIVWFNTLYGMGLEILILIIVLNGYRGKYKKIATLIMCGALLTAGVIFLAKSSFIMATIFLTLAR